MDLPIYQLDSCLVLEEDKSTVSVQREQLACVQGLSF